METRRGDRDSGIFAYEADGYVWLTDPDLSGHVVIPDGAKGIFEGGLSGCKGMTRITIPDSVRGIAGEGFRGCSALTEIYLPCHVTYLAESAFRGCTALTRVSIPASMTSIYDKVFADCPRLTSLCYRGTMAQWATMRRDPAWCAGSSLEIIHCTDGDVIP